MCLRVIYSNEALITLETWTTLAPYNTSLLTSELLRAYARDRDSRTRINIRHRGRRINEDDALLRTAEETRVRGKMPGELGNRRMPQPAWLLLGDDVQRMLLQNINVRSIAARNWDTTCWSSTAVGTRQKRVI